MKMKHIKTAAKLLVQCGYADYVKTTRTQDGTVVCHWVCWREEDCEAEWDDVSELVTPFEHTLKAIGQALALENYLVWNERDLWDESRRNTFRPESAGQYCVQKRRVDGIKWCLKEITKQED